jgi:pimeloyl-ACP methyl ester carboxylesterase
MTLERFSLWFLNQLEMMPTQLVRESVARGPTQLLNALLGQREAEEVRALLDRPSNGHARVPTVFLPGIMGSLLASIRGISALLWINPDVVLDGHLNLLDLSDDATHDRSPDVEIVPVGIEKVTYLRLVLTLAQQSRLYEFPYDWRRPLEYNAGILRACILRWSSAHPTCRFVLVGHSMGGMVARTYVALYPREAEEHLARVVLLGSPLFGAPVAATIFTGEALNCQVVSKLHPQNNVRALTQNMPASYQLLPPPPELFPAGQPYPFNWDLYDARAWDFPGIRQDYLDGARRWHVRMAQTDPQVEMVQIAGCHRSTVVGVWQSPADGDDPPGTPRHFVSVCQESGAESGDDSVPLWSACPSGMVSYYVEENHQNLPSHDGVLNALMALVNGETPDLPRTLPAPSGLLERLRSANVVERALELRLRLESGDLRREDVQNLYFVR